MRSVSKRALWLAPALLLTSGLLPANRVMGQSGSSSEAATIGEVSLDELLETKSSAARSGEESSEEPAAAEALPVGDPVLAPAAVNGSSAMAPKQNWILAVCAALCAVGLAITIASVYWQRPRRLTRSHW